MRRKWRGGGERERYGVVVCSQRQPERLVTYQIWLQMASLGVGSFQLRSVSVDLNADPSLQIDIPDALSEKDRVKFTVHTKIPPAPSKPDFDGPREKMQKLGEGEVSMTKEEFAKMKQELEAEYLAVFKKTVSSHEIFLQRIASHPLLSKDRNFHVFLEYDQDLSVRRKNTKEMFGGFLKSVVKSADEVLFSGVKEVEDFFEQEKTFLVNYYNRIKDAYAKADKMTRSHKNVADDYIYTSACLNSLALEEPTVIKKYLLKVAELFEKLRKVESRVSSDEDLKLSELLRYYILNIEAAKDLLYRRTRALVDYENSNKALDKARLKSKDVRLAEAQQQDCCQKFEKISESAKQELMSFKQKRIAAFRKNLIEMAELEIKHAKFSPFATFLVGSPGDDPEKIPEYARDFQEDIRVMLAEALLSNNLEEKERGKAKSGGQNINGEDESPAWH
ncbi:hypothetical protein DUI87_29869 [Hirundo rustica rustica]|uniref:PX domain-containing protein n=1 Tax=Hirundo rustica rustica TaxID=333673 RepID=A0A3M0IYV4_HIRRU|nr:hypothetical protein DUI87_29869 [Hirundo rustica rustica]